MPLALPGLLGNLFVQIAILVGTVVIVIAATGAIVFGYRRLPSNMFQGTKTVVGAVVAMMILGGIFGVLIASLVGYWYIVVPVLAFLGMNFGLALAYGFLPEAPADISAEPE